MILFVYFAAGILLAIGVKIAGLDSSLHFKGVLFRNSNFDPTLLIVIISALIPIGFALKYKKYLSNIPAIRDAQSKRVLQADLLVVAIISLLGFLLGSYIIL